MKRLDDASRARLARALLVLTTVLVPAALVFALAVAPALAIGAYLVVAACRGLIGPLQSAWVNQTIEDSSVRATVLSIVNQSDAVGQVAGGPAIGAVGIVGRICARPSRSVRPRWRRRSRSTDEPCDTRRRARARGARRARSGRLTSTRAQ